MQEVTPTKTRQKALSVAEAAQDHKALNLRILDVSLKCDYADYFILMSATSTRHAKGLADAIGEACRNALIGVEGYSGGEWVLLDLGDVVVHIFYEPLRSYYYLDKLWADAPSLDISALAHAARKPTRRPASARP